MKRRIYARMLLMIALIIFSFLNTGCAKRHVVVFISETCIKPYKSYTYHTCDKMKVVIDGDYYVIPKNFTTDLASIPRIFWPFLAPQYSGFVAPAILHDYLYSCGNLGTRKWADEVLYSALMAEGVTNYTSLKFYYAVRLFGGSHFEDHNNYCTRNINV